MPATRDSEDVTLPCPLKPGQYEYRIDLFTGETGGGMSGMDNPQSSLNGTLVVD